MYPEFFNTWYSTRRPSVLIFVGNGEVFEESHPFGRGFHLSMEQLAPITPLRIRQVVPIIKVTKYGTLNDTAYVLK